MPSVNGDKVHEYNQDHNKAPFIMLSGDGTQFASEISDFSKDNKCEVVSKPWEGNELIDKILSFLEPDFEII